MKTKELKLTTLILKYLKAMLLTLFYSTKRFIETDSTIYASSMVYVTIFSIVPVVFMLFFVISFFPIFEGWDEILHNILVNYMFDNSSSVIISNVNEIVLQARNTLSIVGGFMLIVNIVWVIARLEKAMNFIWGIKAHRPIWKSFFIYLFALLSLPLVLVTGILTNEWLIQQSSFILELFDRLTNNFFQVAKLIQLISWFSNIFLEILTFTILFVLLPNVKVSWKYGFISGAMLMLLLSVIHSMFSIIVNSFTNYQFLYGAFAALPILLFWLYLLWCIVLWCASLNYTLEKQWNEMIQST